MLEGPCGEVKAVIGKKNCCEERRLRATVTHLSAGEDDGYVRVIGHGDGDGCGVEWLREREVKGLAENSGR